MLAAFLSQGSASKRRLVAIILTSLIGCLVESGSAGAETKLKPEPVNWGLSKPFKESEKARKNLSGAACVPTTPKFTSCLIANDEKKYAQFFSINGTTLKPRKVVRLSDDKKDPDAEGVAYVDGFFYVTGSHGRSRKGNKKNSTSYAVFRLAVDSVTGIPKVKPSAKKVAGIDSTSRLRDVLRDDNTIGSIRPSKGSFRRVASISRESQ